MMIKIKKKFDCLRVKQAAQDKIYEETRGMTWEQERDHAVKSIQSSPLGDKWARIRDRAQKKKTG